MHLSNRFAFFSLTTSPPPKKKGDGIFKVINQPVKSKSFQSRLFGQKKEMQNLRWEILEWNSWINVQFSLISFEYLWCKNDEWLWMISNDTWTGNLPVLAFEGDCDFFKTSRADSRSVLYPLNAPRSSGCIYIRFCSSRLTHSCFKRRAKNNFKKGDCAAMEQKESCRIKCLLKVTLNWMMMNWGFAWDSPEWKMWEFQFTNWNVYTFCDNWAKEAQWHWVDKSLSVSYFWKLDQWRWNSKFFLYFPFWP